jgi:ABC-2 type transport system permease protein
MLAVIILVAFGFNFLMAFAADNNRSYRYYGWGIDDMIRDAETQQYEGWERQVELLTYMKENNIDPVFYYGEINADGWRREAAHVLFRNKDMAAEEGLGGADRLKYIEEIDAAIKNRDWKAYYQTELAIAEKEDPGDFNRDAGLNAEEQKSVKDTAVRIWALRYKIENNIAPDHWKSQIIDDIRNNKQTLLWQYDGVTETDENYSNKAEFLDNIALLEYRLENNIEHYTYEGIENLINMMGVPGFWDVFAGSAMTISVISVLIIVVAGSLLSSEFAAGTVKFLLINPVKRWKIFAAKYAAVLSVTLASVFALYIFNLIFAGIFFGIDQIGAPFLSVANGVVSSGTSVGYVAVKYLLGSVGMLCMATFAFAISSLVRNSALSIGLGVFLFLSGSLVIQVLSALGIYQAKFILFANTDINAVINGTTGFINHTIAFALINIAVYMLVFIWTAWDGFVRNDIK